LTRKNRRHRGILSATLRKAPAQLPPPAFALPFGNIAAYVPIELNEIDINRLERLVLGKADFFFDFGDKG
jgi:hypothetical protein